MRRRAPSRRGPSSGEHIAAAASSLALVAGLVAIAGCGGASQTVVTRTVVDPSSAAAARAAAAAQLAATAHGTNKTGQAAPSTPSTTSTVSSAPTSSTAGSTPAKSSAPAPVSGVLADADAICIRRNGELTALAAKGAAQSSTTTARRAAIEQRALGELAAIKPPASAALAYRQVLQYSRIALSQGSQPGEQGQLRLLVAAVRAGVKHCAAVN